MTAQSQAQQRRPRAVPAVPANEHRTRQAATQAPTTASSPEVSLTALGGLVPHRQPDPGDMTPEARLAELGVILAAGFRRYRHRQNVLATPRPQSVHRAG